MRRMKLVKQHDEKDCGAACLAMILSYYGKKVPLAQVREAIKVDQYGANVYGVIDGASKYALSGEGLEGLPEEVWETFTSRQVKMPAIVRILNESGYEHFVVVNDINMNNISLFDPDQGKVKMKKEKFLSCCLGHVIELTPDPDFKKENNKKGEFGRFFDMILCQKKLLLEIAVLSALVTGIGLAGSFVFQYIIDSGLGNVSNLNTMSEWLEHFGIVLIGLMILYLFRALFQLSRGKLLTIMSKNIDLSLMIGYYDHVSGLPLEFFETRKNGEITSRFNDASKIRDALSNATLTVMIDVVMVIACGIILARESLTLFGISFVIFSGYAIISAVCIKPLDKLNRKVMEKNALFSAYVKESIDGMETVKAAQAEVETREKTNSLFQGFMDNAINGALLSMKKDTAIEALTSVGTLIILWFGVLSIIDGKMTIGTLITFNTLLGYFLTPVQNVVELQGSIQSAVVAADRLNDILSLSVENQDGIDLTGNIEKIEFNDIDFRYGNRELVLNKLNLSFSGGEKVAFVGESGSGKSTLVKLLMGMYSTEVGEVLINGTAINKISLNSLRKRTAYVSQNTFMFSGSIRDNLLLGIDKVDYPTDEHIYKVLDVCKCSFVQQMPLGIDSALEENGVNLSGGQKQRLAIARAILRNPQILILDEATSALDTITEFEIQGAIEQLVPEATVVMVAHRLSTVRKCDKIFVIENGYVLEQGSHDELLLQKGLYSELWCRQYDNR